MPPVYTVSTYVATFVYSEHIQMLPPVYTVSTYVATVVYSEHIQMLPPVFIVPTNKDDHTTYVW